MEPGAGRKRPVAARQAEWRGAKTARRDQHRRKDRPDDDIGRAERGGDAADGTAYGQEGDHAEKCHPYEGGPRADNLDIEKDDLDDQEDRISQVELELGPGELP